jgi:hypothetical protein
MRGAWEQWEMKLEMLISVCGIPLGQKNSPAPCEEVVFQNSGISIQESGFLPSSFVLSFSSLILHPVSFDEPSCP